MTLVGMNIPEVRRIAAQLRRSSESVSRCSADIDRLMQTARNNWAGEDIARFQSLWNAHLRAVAQRVSADLRELAITAERNADAQERTSNELEGATGGGGSTGGGSESGGSTGGSESGGSDGGDTGGSDENGSNGGSDGGGSSGEGGGGGGDTDSGHDHDRDVNDSDDFAEPGDINARYDIVEGDTMLLGAEAEASGSTGNDAIGTQGEASAMAGVKGEAEVYASATGLAAGTSIMAGVAASAKGSAYLGPLTAAGEVEAMAGAKAEVKGQVGLDGLSFQGEAFAGAKAEAKGSVDVGGVGVGGSAEAWAGVGVEANVNANVTDGKLHLSGEFGAALGLGGSVGLDVTIDMNKVADTLSDAAGAVGDFFGGLW